MINGNPRQLHNVHGSGDAARQRRMIMLVARAAVFAVGVVLGIRFGIEVAKFTAPSVLTRVSLGLCFLVQVIISTIQLYPAASPQVTTNEDAQLDGDVVHLHQSCKQDHRMVTNGWSDRRCIAG